MNILHRFKLALPLTVQLGIACSAGILPVPAAASIFYNGINCVPVAGTAGFSGGRIFNHNATYTLYVECPVIKDTFGGLESGWVRAIDYHPTQNVHCILRSQGRTSVSARRISSTGAGGEQELPRSEGVAVGGQGYRTYFSCEIPPRSAAGSSGIDSYTAMPPI